MTPSPSSETARGLPPRSAVVDLRQYRCHPGRRDELVELFDAHFVGGQERAGMHVLGEFRDLDDPDRFVWLRGFDAGAARGQALGRFYDGPVWSEHGDAANATMADFSDARMLNPLYLTGSYPRFGRRDPGWDLEPDPTSQFTLTVYPHLRSGDADAISDFLSRVAPFVVGAGGRDVAAWVSDPSDNTFPRLPVRRDSVLVHLVRHEGDEAHLAFVEALRRSPGWDDVRRSHSRFLGGPPQLLRLRPTRRSQLR